MKKLFIKELREHFKVALLGLAVFSAMLVLAFAACTNLIQRLAYSNGYFEADNLHPLLASSVWTQAAFFCAIFGTLLGWLQIRAEKHPDLWAFLVHRPITRATILRSKIFSGLLLYAAGAGLPLLGLIIAVSIPGHVAAPFEWAMTLPLVSIFLVGMVFYFGGLLTGLRKARWYGSRIFGIGPAVLATLAIFAMPEFWQALLIIVGAGAVLELAVWGSFKTGGYYREQPLPGKLALSVASALSITLLIGLLFGLTFNLLSSHLGYTHTQYQFTKDGAIVKVTYRSAFGAIEDTEIVDLDGKPVLNKNGQKIKLKELQERFAMGLSASVDFGDRLNQLNRRRASYCSMARFFHPWRVVEKTLWYLTYDGRLIAYNGITRQRVGNLQPAGAPSALAPDDSRFLRPYNYWNRSFTPYQMPEILPSARTAYFVDLETRELRPLFTTMNADPIGGYFQMFSPLYPANSNVVLIVSRAAVRLFDFAGNLRLQVPFEPSYPTYSAVNVFLLDPPNTFAVRFEPDYFVNQKRTEQLLSHVKWVNPDGTVRNEMDLPKLPEIQRDMTAEQYSIALLPPSIPIYPKEPSSRVANMLRFVIVATCALVGVWLARRNNFPRKATIGWGIFLLLAGVPGLLAFFAVQEWPAKESCSHCQKLRVVNRETCEHCGAAFAPPAKTGTEIFEPLTAC